MKRLTSVFFPIAAVVGFVSLPMQSSQAATPETELSFVLNPDAAIHPFVANYGQDDPAVLFAARSFGGTVFVRDDGLALALAADRAGRRASTTIGFVNALALDAYEGEPAGATANFYLGAEPASWLEDLPTHADVDLLEVAPGVGLQVDASGRDMRWSIDTSDPDLLSDLRWTYDDALSLEIDGEGRLSIELPAYDEQGLEIPGASRRLLAAAPRAWQGEGELVSVTASYVVEGGQVRVELSGVEPGQPVVVELMTRYSGRRGAEDSLRAGANTWAQGSSEPMVAGTGGDASTDMMSLRLDESGRQISALTVVGGDAHTSGGGLGLGGNGRVWLTGTTRADDFPTFAAVQPKRAGGSDAALVELDADGHLISSSYYGGSGDDEGDDVEIDEFGTLWLAGKAELQLAGPEISLGFGTRFTDGGEYRDLFLTAIDTGTLNVEGTTCFGGFTPNGDPSVTVDAQGSVWVGTRSPINQAPTSVVSYTESAQHTGGDCGSTNINGWGYEAMCWKHHASGVAYQPASLPTLPTLTCLNANNLSSQCHTQANNYEADPTVFPTDPAGVWEGPYALYNDINLAESGEEILIAAALYMHRWGSPVYANGVTPTAPAGSPEAFGIHTVSFDSADDPANDCAWAGFYATSTPGWQNYPIYQVADNCSASTNLAIVDTQISYWEWTTTQSIAYTPSYWTGPGASWWWWVPGTHTYAQVYIGDPPVDERFMAAHVDEYASLAADGVAEDQLTARTWYEGGVVVDESLAVERAFKR